jgi:hypothetical protein
MRQDNDFSRWLQLLAQAFRRTPVLALAAAGLGLVIGASFVSGYWQAFLLQVGIVMIFISPIVVTERIAVTEEVKQLRSEVVRLSEIPRVEQARVQKVEQLFSRSTDYTSADLLALLKASMIERAITRCGVAVPLRSGDYSTLLGISLNPEIGTHGVYFQPRYVIEGQSEVLSQILYHDRDARQEVIRTRRILDPDKEPSLSGMLMGVRNELLRNERHPQMELDFEDICARLKRTLILGLEARRPGSKYRTGLEAVIAVVEPDLAITVEGIQHISDPATKTVSKFDVWSRAGLPERVPHETAQNKKWMKAMQEAQIRESGIADHPDFKAAISVIRTLYISTFLWPIIQNPK